MNAERVRFFRFSVDVWVWVRIAGSRFRFARLPNFLNQ